MLYHISKRFQEKPNISSTKRGIICHTGRLVCATDCRHDGAGFDGPCRPARGLGQVVSSDVAY